nr:organic cation/carnitine transporter 3 [Quercus suber]
MSLSSLLTVFSTNIWAYSALRLVCGFGRATIGTCALVLTIELVGKGWRGQVGVIAFFCFTIGFYHYQLQLIGIEVHHGDLSIYGLLSQESCILRFGIGMVYYGMPLGLGNLSFNLYLSVTFNASFEIPSSLFIILLIELFPTCVRNTAATLVRQALVFGGVFGPMLVAAERRNGISSYGVFGLVIGCCGLLAVCLPETRGRALCDTMDEEEHKESSM